MTTLRYINLSFRPFQMKHSTSNVHLCLECFLSYFFTNISLAACSLKTPLDAQIKGPVLKYKPKSKWVAVGSKYLLWCLKQEHCSSNTRSVVVDGKLLPTSADAM